MTADGHTEHRRKRAFLVRSAAALISTSMVTSALGFVYWVLAARLFPAADVGESATAIAAMSLIAPLTMLGFGTLLIAELPGRRTGRASQVSTAALISFLIGSLMALTAALTLPGSFLGLSGIGSNPVITALFVLGAATQGVGLILDQALLSLVGGGMQLLRNTIQSIGKVVLLVLLALTLSQPNSTVIFLSWFAANAVSVVAMVVIVMRRMKVPLARVLPDLSTLRGRHFDAARHHILNISLFVPFFAMPIVANVILGSEQAGYLYAAWSIAGFVFHLPISLALALFASGARDTSTFLLEFRFTVRYALLICLAANLIIFVLGGAVLGIFGRAYAENAHTALITVCLGGLGLVIKDHHVALARVTDRVGREAALLGVLGAGELAGAAIGAALGGLTGLALGWVAAVAVEVVVCGPLVLRAYRGRLPIPLRVTPAAGAEHSPGRT